MNRVITTSVLCISILGIGLTEAIGQIAPPDFNCVQNDTLNWDMPNPSCGPLEGYEIYYSNQENGPFSLLTTINEPDSLRYFHNHLSDSTFYYYILTQADCPGQSSIPSDTLDNQPPRPPIIEAVSVINGNVEVKWTPSVSPETVGYVIYRATGMGTVPIDTVYSGTAFTDDQAAPETEEQYYYVLSLDDCGNTSIFDITHHTIFVASGVDSCRQSVHLNWSLYENWIQGIKDHIVYVREDGGPESPIDTLSGGTTSFSLNDINDSTEYCITIEARENQTLETSRSNELCINPDIVEPMDYLHLLNASVTGQNEIQLQWEWDPDAELKEIELERQRDGITEMIDNNLPLQPLMSQEQFTDNNIGLYEASVTYQVQTTDLCDTVIQSNTIETIYLKGENGQGASNLLQWSAFSSPLSTVQSYELFTTSGGSMTSIASLPPDSFQYRHLLDVDQTQNASLCYKVEAVHTVDVPGQTPRDYRSSSNMVCLDQNVNVYVPNAFAPQGSNQFFKPVFTFPQNINSYRMNIYDRFGGRIFSTSSIDEGWYGQEADGDRSPAGVYVYLLKWETTNGTKREKRGTVLLIR